MRAMFEIKIEVVVIPYLLKTFTSPQAKDMFHRYLTCCWLSPARNSRLKGSSVLIFKQFTFKF